MIDLRSRIDGPRATVATEAFFDDLPDLLDAHRGFIGPGVGLREVREAAPVTVSQQPGFTSA
jgi:hypothetical protein